MGLAVKSFDRWPSERRGGYRRAVGVCLLTPTLNIGGSYNKPIYYLLIEDQLGEEGHGLVGDLRYLSNRAEEANPKLPRALAFLANQTTYYDSPPPLPMHTHIYEVFTIFYRPAPITAPTEKVIIVSWVDVSDWSNSTYYYLPLSKLPPGYLEKAQGIDNLWPYGETDIERDTEACFAEHVRKHKHFAIVPQPKRNDAIVGMYTIMAGTEY